MEDNLNEKLSPVFILHMKTTFSGHCLWQSAFLNRIEISLALRWGFPSFHQSVLHGLKTNCTLYWWCRTNPITSPHIQTKWIHLGRIWHFLLISVKHVLFSDTKFQHFLVVRNHCTLFYCRVSSGGPYDIYCTCFGLNNGTININLQRLDTAPTVESFPTLPGLD